MRHILRDNRYKAAAGVGMLILIGSITASLVLWQRDDGPKPTVGLEVSALAPLGLPSPTNRVTVEDRGPENSGATFSILAGESFELKNQRNASALAPAPPF